MRTLTRDIGMSQQLSLGAKVPLPFADEKVAQDRGALGSLLTFAEPKGDKSLLTIDKNKVVTNMIADEIVSTITKPYINEHTREMAVAMVNMYEKDILSNVKTSASMSFSTTAVDGTSIKKIFLDAIEAMNDAHIPMADRWLVLDNASYSSILDWLTTIPFAKADNVLNTGIVGELFGLKIAVSSFADGIYFGHRNGIVRAHSLTKTDINHSLERQATLMAGHMVYGITAPKEGAWLGKVRVGSPATDPPRGSSDEEPAGE